MSLITLKENRMIALGRDSVDFAVVAGCDIEGAGVVENDVANVLGTGIEIGGRAPGRFRASLGGCRSSQRTDTQSSREQRSNDEQRSNPKE